MIREPQELEKLTAINIGCGSDQASQYINVDIRDDVNADLVCDCHALPFPDERFELVFSSHCLEHFSHRETRTILTEWLRVLKKGGMLKLILPDIDVAFKSGQAGDYGTMIGVLYGAQDYPTNFHYMGFNEDYLRKILTEIGIEITNVHKGGYEMIVTGVKK